MKNFGGPEAISVASGLCRRFEGCRLKAYICPAGVWTVGFGATGYGVQPGLEVTQEWAEKRLQADLQKFLRGTMILCPSLSGAALGAITDFAFNVGLGALAASTLRKRLNAGDMDGAKAQLARWVNGGGKRLPGLVLRRAAEASLL